LKTASHMYTKTADYL